MPQKSSKTYTKTDFERDVEDGNISLPADVVQLISNRTPKGRGRTPTGNGAYFLRTKHRPLFNALYEKHVKETGAELPCNHPGKVKHLG